MAHEVHPSVSSGTPTVDLLDIIARVERLNICARRAREWTGPTSCGVGDLRGGSCQHAQCHQNAALWAGYWTREAAHEANELRAALSALSGQTAPQQKEEEDTRVAPLKAGADGQDLPQSGNGEQ